MTNQVEKAIGQLGGNAGQLLAHEHRAWRSATFSGTRHRLTYAFDGAESVAHGEHLIATLPEEDFSMHGQLVAGAAIVQVDHRFEPPRLEVDLELMLLEQA